MSESASNTNLEAEISYDEALRRFQHFQRKGQEGTLTQTEIRECIAVTRILRRTNTGPGKAKTARGKKAAPLVNLSDL